MLHNPLGNVLGKPPLSFLPLDPLGSDLVDKFPAPSIRGPRLDTRPILDSRSSSPSDSDTSGFSSGSDHLSDLISSLRISPPLPFLSLTGGGPRDPLNMGVGSRMDQEQAALAAVTPSPTSASKRWPGASVWPSWDLLEAPKDPFSIEREARLHRPAAGKCGHAPAVGPEPSFSGQTSDLSGRGLDCMVESLHLHRMVCFEE